MSIRTMTADDLALVLDWAAQEGWNPGLDDADAFLAADPAGFFVKEADGEPVAAISVVNHSASFAFLGLYICRPDRRGQGHGMDVWKAGIAHAGARVIGLDGVPDQQENYANSGFVRHGATTRLGGVLPGGSAPEPASIDPEVLMASDSIHQGYSRPRFLSAWLAQSPARQTFALSRSAFATARLCREGLKVGPFYAQTPDEAASLFAAIAAAYPGKTTIVDVPDNAPQMGRMLADWGFARSFETARMYRGAPPDAKLPDFYGVGTLELG